MKRNIIIAIIIGVSVFTAGCSKAGDNKTVNNLIEIKEKMFLAQVNDVYLNVNDYLGKAIKLEGLFKQEGPYCFVLRYGPGCCGNDGNVGFEVAWADGKKTPYPKPDSWVEATGVLKSYTEAGNDFLYYYLDLSSLNVVDKQGSEYVLQ
jgi:uncharacterized membrane protein YcgQ (UPF0703/DUF1980 family)